MPISTEQQGETEGLQEGCILTEFTKVDQVLELIENIPACAGDPVFKEKCDELITRILDEYLEQPHLLDPHLHRLLQKLLSFITSTDGRKEERDIAFRYLYLLCKVRGYKNMTKKFPHEVNDIRPILDLLSNQQAADPWETRYVLLLWLSMICLIPFDMDLFDDPKKIAEGSATPMSLRIMDLGKHYLIASSDNSQEAAAVLLAKYLIRPDTTSNYLESFVSWCLEKISASNHKLTEVKGCLRCLGLVFKWGKRDELYPLCVSVLEADYQMIHAEATVLRKLAVKLAQRVGMTLLKPRVASWRYQRGSRLLDSTLTGFKPTLKENNEDEDNDDFEVSEDILTVLYLLLTGLEDRDTIVRWSSAKGIGRITGRLSKCDVDTVLDWLLDVPGDGDDALHGRCLAVAELGRRGLLPAERLDRVVRFLVESLSYYQQRGASSVGSNVRDAACYVAWAFARAYDPSDLAGYVSEIARALLITAVFDREVNCRRAASAAFQENVGRQGSFPHGIDIVTLADYFAVSNRSKSYLEVAPKVAAFGDYTTAFMDDLVGRRTGHWDEEVRWLAAEAMNMLTRFQPQYVADRVFAQLLPSCTGMDTVKRHGSIIMVAEIVSALDDIERDTGDTSLLSRNRCLEEIYDIVVELEAAGMFQGRSGEQTRVACSHLIAKLSQSVLSTPQPTRQAWAKLLHDNLSHLHLFTNSHSVCRLTIAALSAMHRNSLTAPSAFDASLDASVKQYLSFLKSDIESKRCGYAQAIATFPRVVLEGRLMRVLRALFQASQVTSSDDLSFADARRDAVGAVARVCQTLGVTVDDDNNPDYGVCRANVDEIYDAIFCALEDYTRDSRGDVGSYVRGAAITALQDITSMVAREKPELLSQSLLEMIAKKLIRQACEKLRTIRVLAVDALIALMYNENLNAIPHRDELIEIFPRRSRNLSITELFKRLSRTLDLEKYAYETLLGLVVSVGDLTQFLAEASGNALQQYMSTSKTDAAVKLENILGNLIKILRLHSKRKRVTIPFLKTLNHLLVSDSFDALNSDEYVGLQLDLIEQIKGELSRSKDVQKVLLSVPVFCNLLFFVNSKVRSKVMFQLMLFLCHRFPVVRKATSAQLYEQLNIYTDLVEDDEHLETIFSYLLEIEWDQDDINKLKEKRNEMCVFFNVPVPQIKSKNVAS